MTIDKLNSRTTKITTKLLEAMGLKALSIDVKQEADRYILQIELADPEKSLLIGRHGEGIDSLQLILNLMLNQGEVEWLPFQVNIGDYRQQREEVLKNLGAKAAATAKSTGNPVRVSFLPSHERRIIHLFLSEDPDIETFSEGTGRFRRLVIKPRSL